MRLETKIRDKGHIYRKYQKAETPYRWLLESEETPLDVKEKLETIYESLNPAELKRKIEFKLSLLARVYAQEHAQSEQKEQLKETATVRFSNYSTGRVGLGSLII